MKFLTLSRLLVALTLVIGLAGISLYAQQDPAAQTPPATPPQEQQQTPPPDQQSQPTSQEQTSQSPAAQQPQIFSGKIVKSHGMAVLRDEATSTDYKLDNEDQAKQYMGKNVRVTGTLDPSTNTIRVTNIEMSSNS